MPRSLYFSYEGESGNILGQARRKVSLDLSGWKAGVSSGNLREVFCPKNLGTWPIKFIANALVDALPGLSAVRIEPEVFIDFLAKEGAEEDSWTLRFWEIDQKKGWSRAITAGREKPDIANAIVIAMNRADRPTVWAGVEFTHPKFGSRVMMHRWPVASICHWGEAGSAYMKVKNRFVDLLRKII